MYNLPYHKESDEQVIKEFIDKYPFAFLCGCDEENKPIATQVPLLLEKRAESVVLLGHIMKNTDHHKAFLHNPQVLAVFTGPHCYISATTYDNPNTASTWNYMSVHAQGKIHFLEDKELNAMLQRTSLHFENNDQHSPTVFENLPKRFTQKMMNAIVAFEIEVMEMDTVFKLSQDREAKSYSNIINHLKSQGDNERAVAKEMEKRSGELFGGEKKN